MVIVENRKWQIRIDFLLQEKDILEPLMSAIINCLEHRHSYVRRNAVLAIYTIYRNFEQLIPDAPEIIANFLEREQDMSCKRNAFIMLIHTDQERALSYLASCIDQVRRKLLKARLSCPEEYLHFFLNEGSFLWRHPPAGYRRADLQSLFGEPQWALALHSMHL